MFLPSIAITAAPQNQYCVPTVNDQRWMSQYRERQERAKRWKNAFGFLPLNFLRFASLLAAFVSSLNDSLDSLLSANRSPGAAHLNRAGEMRWGKGGKKKKRRKSKSARVKSKTADSHSYTELEQRQLLATLCAVDHDCGLRRGRECGWRGSKRNA